jgi:hypothetical protein
VCSLARYLRKVNYERPEKLLDGAKKYAESRLKRRAFLHNQRETDMKYLMIAVLLLGGFVTFAATKEASAVVCAAGVYRAGCVGVRGAAVVRRPVVRRRVY